MRTFLDRRPHLVALVPVLLDRGDPTARTLALNLAVTADTPPLQAALRDFALSPRGPDDQRIQASAAAGEAGLMPHGSVKTWVRGRQVDTLLLNYEISFEPQHKHSDEVAGLAADAALALNEDDAERAEQLLRRALQLEPDAPDLLNNLAGAREALGHPAEAHVLMRQVHGRFPDYWFGTVSVARLELRAGRTSEAEALLKPLLQKRQLHVSEFVALATAYMDLLLHKGERQGARTWLDLWERIAPDHPTLPYWQMRVRGPDFFDGPPARRARW